MKPAPDADEILGAQIGTLWMVFRAFAATHQNLGSLIAELRILEEKEKDHGLALPVSDRAIEFSHAALRELIEVLEKVHKDRGGS